MKQTLMGFVSLLTVLWTGCGGLKNDYPVSTTIVVENPLTHDRQDALVKIDITEIAGLNADAFIILSDGKEIASQTVDLDGDGRTDQIAFVLDIPALTSKSLTLRYATEGEMKHAYPKRTQAEISRKSGGEFADRIYQGGQFQNVDFLRVPPEHTDHSFFIRYEGPGWESDKVGYRFYLDWRNATDVFGKKSPEMVLQNVGLDGFDSYHEMSDWGMDILKVGESLGIGSAGLWNGEQAQRISVTDSVTCQIVNNGPLFSSIRTCYFGWKVGFLSYDVISDLSIHAGSRLTCHSLQIQGEPANLCTGIVKDDSAEVITLAGANWAALATWGRQSLAGDALGMAVLYRNQDFTELTADAYSQVVVLAPQQGQLTYYFLAAWEKEPEGIQSKEAFIQYLEETLRELDEPITVSL